MTLKLIEHPFNGSVFVDGGTLTFNPDPNAIDKSVKVEWRARHTGLYSLYPRCKYRYRRTVEFTLKGGCTSAKRKEIEFYAMRYSKFLMDNTTWAKILSPEYYSERTVQPSTMGWPHSAVQTLYLMFTECTFTLEEGKEDWWVYTIKLQVVNNEGIS